LSQSAALEGGASRPWQPGHDSYPSAADTGFSAGTERVFLKNALRREVEELGSVAEREGYPPMDGRLKGTLLRLGDLGVQASQAASELLGESCTLLRPAFFLEGDCVNVVFHSVSTARRLSLDLSWPDGSTVDLYQTDAEGTRKFGELAGLPDKVGQLLMWLLHA